MVKIYVVTSFYYLVLVVICVFQAKFLLFGGFGLLSVVSFPLTSVGLLWLFRLR